MSVEYIKNMEKNTVCRHSVGAVVVVAIRRCSRHSHKKARDVEVSSPVRSRSCVHINGGGSFGGC